MNAISLKLIITVIEVLSTQGIPAFFKFVESLNNNEKVTVEEIEKLKGELDSRSYFE